MSIPKNIKDMENYSLSDKDIRELCPRSNIVTYDTLKDVDHIDDILGNDDSVFILYLTSSNYGHWCLVFLQNNVLQYFNSYGTEPDDDFKKIDKSARYEFNQVEPILYELLAKSGYDVEYNDKCLQGPKTSTCGSHCYTRLLNRDKNSKDYVKVIKSYKEIPDYLVSLVAGSGLNFF